jgi:large subunit ribosomal protein L1
VGKASFSEDALTENVRSLLEALVKAKPTGAKGQYVKAIALSSTMGPGVKVDVSEASAPAENA